MVVKKIESNAVIGHFKRSNSSDQNIMFSIATDYNCLTGEKLPSCNSWKVIAAENSSKSYLSSTRGFRVDVEFYFKDFNDMTLMQNFLHNYAEDLEGEII
jgi:hypothetical protein